MKKIMGIVGLMGLMGLMAGCATLPPRGEVAGVDLDLRKAAEIRAGLEEKRNEQVVAVGAPPAFVWDVIKSVLGIEGRLRILSYEWGNDR
jgi:hypothetical protein